MTVRLIVSIVALLLLLPTAYVSATAQAMVERDQSVVQCDGAPFSATCQDVVVQYLVTVELHQRDTWRETGIEQGQEWISYMLYPGPTLEAPMRVPIACEVESLAGTSATVYCDVGGGERKEIWQINRQTLQPQQLVVTEEDQLLHRYIFQ